MNMTFDELLNELTRRKIRLERHGDSLRLQAPKGSVDNLLRAALTEHKAQLLAGLAQQEPTVPEAVEAGDGHWSDLTFEHFMTGTGPALDEVEGLDRWRQAMRDDNLQSMFEIPHLSPQTPMVRIPDKNGEVMELLSFASYNYLGYATDPQVLQAAKDALDAYGLGASASPVLTGTMGVHKELEEALVDMMGQPGYGVSLFCSGYSTNLGAISAFLNPGQYLVCDRKAHMSILEGGKLAGAKIRFFDHNDAEDLDRVLNTVDPSRNRTLVAVEGIYSVDGDFGRIDEISEVTKRHGAYLLVDEAHSMLLTGEGGRGVCAEQGVLDKVDMLVMTLSKSFGGVGGALYAPEKLAHYINWYARCRMFSTALDPGVCGGLALATRMTSGEDGERRRARLHRNAEYLRNLLSGRVDVGETHSWIIPLRYGSHTKTAYLSNWLRNHGLEVGVVSYPAVPKDSSRLRLFVTSEHTTEQLDRAAEILLRAADEFDFRIDGGRTVDSGELAVGVSG